MTVVGVVPIFMGAGTALLPTVLGILASVVAVLLKPREWAGLVRRRPVAAVSWVGALAVIGVLGGWMMTRTKPLAKAAGTDWAKVAQAILTRQAAGGNVPVATTGASTARAHAVVIGGDYSRCNVVGAASPTGLKELWRYAPDETMFLATPAVYGNHMYVAGSVAGLGDYSGLLACLDLDTGKRLWAVDQAKRADKKTRSIKAFFSSPAITADGKHLVIGQGLHADTDCGLLCFNAETGKQEWVVGTTLHLESSPAIGTVPGVGEIAVIGAGAIEGTDGMPTGNAGEVIAVHMDDGKEVWRVPVNDPESSPAMDADGNVYIGSGFNGQALVALAGKDGHRLWTADTGLPMLGPITVDGDFIIAGGGNSDVVHSAANARGLVVAVDRKTGKIAWQTPFSDAVLGGIAARDGTLACPVRTGEVVALSEKNGSVLWRTHISGNAPIVSGCALTADRVYAVSNDGFLAILDARTGKLLEKTYFNDQAKAGTGLTVGDPQVHDGRVIAGSETGGVRLFVGTR
ncbi:MAG TPA: PQQ-binding-like beta-propeller repeat protein [Phycisphaerae bacterium]|nr:PQQ-binding-like beta-propeller repeat protein [Phycisphaerae bacterium]